MFTIIMTYSLVAFHDLHIQYVSGVMGPDEYHFNVNNSVYTNYNARLSLLLPKYIKDYLNR